ncbi:MAG: GTP-binding protein [Myxococcota bacterium]
MYPVTSDWFEPWLRAPEARCGHVEVVAADDGFMPQTREHLDVLRLLNVPAGVVVLSKCDLVDTELLELIEEDIRSNVVGTVFAEAPIVRTSSKTGRGL